MGEGVGVGWGGLPLSFWKPKECGGRVGVGWFASRLLETEGGGGAGTLEATTTMVLLINPINPMAKPKPSETCNMSYSPNMEEEYQKFIQRMNPPRVVIDNDSCQNATIIQVDSANKHGILLEVVQILTDLNFVVTKAYISSDGGWFMDVFNVTDQEGNKIIDEEVLDYVRKWETWNGSTSVKSERINESNNVELGKLEKNL
ncbi:hypothetical protein OSB04_019575 [Centaurea solstitialis]|uniref:ACT domain-containing protein ACR n=1 Tax=Centaurea solstitialis TaxID=347529 RepID=A0AA38T934_9ASTR|nr:hypothetical protein OSB04_019575 [Centaurea solstitialis]